ncbi:MAG: ribulose-phosphate 3-epimerase [Deltaproteobacteria bacterium]|nr:ribulose-phosphate 3-epimerase [Deltaproteobacteria bacterium]
MKLIAASILSADFSRLKDEIQAVESAGADWLHMDIMDGHFVPNITFGPPVLEKLKKISTKPFDVHLMIQNADCYLESFVKAGADLISVQVEACPHLHRTLGQIKKLGAKAAAVLNPHTPLSCLEYVLADLDMVLLMSVNPGFGGQSFIPSALEKAKKLKAWREEKKLNFLIEMDGGIKTQNIAEISKAGVDVFVVGSGIFETANYSATISELKKKI